MSLSTRDKQILWHPFTQEKTAAPAIAITHASGVYLYDEQQRRYLDLISSWWVNLHGHAHPAIAEAIYQQALTLEHVIFAGFTHAPAVTLCEQLQRQLPPTLCRFFFSDNGSTSVETALKMAYQYWSNQHEPHRTSFLSFTGGYHGDTFGAMSVGAHSGFHDPFTRLCFATQTVPFPATWDNDTQVKEKEDTALTVLADHLRQHSNHIAAMIIEPLIQGASGMRICRPEFIKQVVTLLHTYHIPVIFDEVMTGFYRTGSYFALEQTGAVPDFLCLSKGLTGGFLPLALTVTTEAVYHAFLSEQHSHTFLHGHSYTANPLGCAAANASLQLLQHPDTLLAIQAIAQTHRQGIQHLQQHCPQVTQTRTMGTLAAFTLPTQQSNALAAALLKQGILIRPLGQTVYLLPPYAVTADVLANAYDQIAEILRAPR